MLGFNSVTCCCDETVRRFLGHRNIQTTTSFYIGLQTTQAAVEFGKIVRQQMKFDVETA
jgi:hypothetical protein